MKIKYEFANEAVEIEVEEKWATIVLDLDREEYNDNHRETRRHCSLDALNLDDTLLPSDVDVFEAVADAEGKRNLYMDYGQQHSIGSQCHKGSRSLPR